MVGDVRRAREAWSSAAAAAQRLIKREAAVWQRVPRPDRGPARGARRRRGGAPRGRGGGARRGPRRWPRARGQDGEAAALKQAQRAGREAIEAALAQREEEARRAASEADQRASRERAAHASACAPSLNAPSSSKCARRRRPAARLRGRIEAAEARTADALRALEAAEARAAAEADAARRLRAEADETRAAAASATARAEAAEAEVGSSARRSRRRSGGETRGGSRECRRDVGGAHTQHAGVSGAGGPAAGAGPPCGDAGAARPPRRALDEVARRVRAAVEKRDGLIRTLRARLAESAAKEAELERLAGPSAARDGPPTPPPHGTRR